MVGRKAELAAVGSALDAVHGGSAAIIISGDPGIGKTTVWRHGIAEAQVRGYRVTCCRPAESETWLSFSGLADLFAQVPAQALDGLPDPQREALEVALLHRTAARTGTDHRAISMAVTAVVRALAAAGPVVVAVDDLQWLDAPTAEVLAYLVRRLGGEPVLLLATARGTPLEGLPAGLEQALDDDRAMRVRLGPLTAQETHELLQDRTQLVVARPELLRLHEVSGGNPLFAIEIARALQRSGSLLVPGEPVPVPGSLAGLVAARISTLSERTRTALLVTSALAHPTVDRLKAAMSDGERVPGAGEGLLDSAEEYGIVEIRDGLIRFTHPLFSSVIYASASAARRRQVHQRLAGIVPDAEEQAWHLALGVPGPDQDVAEALEKAARTAQARGAARAAARLWELASRRTPAGDSEAANRRTMAAAVHLLLVGDAGRARSMLEALIEGMPGGRPRARAQLWLATVLFYEGSSVAAARLCRSALAEAGPDPLLRARLHLRAAWFSDHDTSARLRDAEAATGILDRGGATADPDILACAVVARGYYRFLAGLGTGLDDLARARRLLSPDGRSWEWAWARYILCQWTKSLDLTQAYDDCRVLRQLAADRGDESAVAHTLFHLAEIECWLGHLQQARAHAAEAAAGFAQTGQRRWRGLALYITALPDAYLGEVEAVRAAAEQGLEIAASDEDPYVAVLHLGLLGFTSLSQGEFAAADRYLSRADEFVTSMGLAEPVRHRFHGDHLETVLVRGDLDRAIVLQQRLEDRLRRAPYPWLKVIAARGRAMVQAARGDLDAAAQTVQQALAESQAAAMPFEHARTLLAAGQIRRRRKEKRQAREALERARQIFDNLQTPLWSALATAEISRLGLRRTARYDLTPTEESVARLVASGLTNREVASALHISHKTVEANLSRVFRKQGIHSRRELCGNASLGDDRGPFSP